VAERHQQQCPVESAPGQPCPIASDAADCAVRKVFAILGVDIDVPKEVEDFRENLRFGAYMRKMVDRGGIAIFVTLCGIILVAALNGISSAISHWPKQ
jgi:hypothetical protein